MTRAREITQEEATYLNNLYTDPKRPGSYTGITGLYNAVRQEGKYNLSKNIIQKWLRGRQAYTTTRQRVNNFLRPSVVVAGIDDTWDIDLIDLSWYAKINDSYRYAILCIDIFSRYLWGRPLKTKSEKEEEERTKKKGANTT